MGPYLTQPTHNLKPVHQLNTVPVPFKCVPVAPFPRLGAAHEAIFRLDVAVTHPAAVEEREGEGELGRVPKYEEGLGVGV